MMKPRIRLLVSRKMSNGQYERFYVNVFKETKEAVRRNYESMGFEVRG